MIKHIYIAHPVFKRPSGWYTVMIKTKQYISTLKMTETCHSQYKYDIGIAFVISCIQMRFEREIDQCLLLSTTSSYDRGA